MTTLRIDGDWLVEVVDHHTCGTGADGHYGIHEPGCGEIPLIDLTAIRGMSLAVVSAVAGHVELPAGTAEHVASATLNLIGAIGDLVTERDQLRERLREKQETNDSLLDAYRTAVGVPPSEHQIRRLEAMAQRLEECQAELRRLTDETEDSL